MIKGVNRQIIEVMDTGNQYFERALLVVRPGYTDTEPTRLREEAQRMLRKAGGYAGLKPAATAAVSEGRPLRLGGRLRGGAGGGAAVAALPVKPAVRLLQAAVRPRRLAVPLLEAAGKVERIAEAKGIADFPDGLIGTD